MTMPVPSRSVPSVSALRASGIACVRTVTRAEKNFSASMLGAVPSVARSAALRDGDEHATDGNDSAADQAGGIDH